MAIDRRHVIVGNYRRSEDPREKERERGSDAPKTGISAKERKLIRRRLRILRGGETAAQIAAGPASVFAIVTLSAAESDPLVNASRRSQCRGLRDSRGIMLVVKQVVA